MGLPGGRQDASQRTRTRTAAKVSAYIAVPALTVVGMSIVGFSGWNFGAAGHTEGDTQSSDACRAVFLHRHEGYRIVDMVIAMAPSYPTPQLFGDDS